MATAFEDVPPLQTFHVYDPVTGRLTHLNPYTFVARQIVVNSPPPPQRDTVPASSTATSNPLKSEDLGTKTFENRILKGVRQSRDMGITDGIGILRTYPSLSSANMKIPSGNRPSR
ncbi:MAG: hypothetical protein WBX22_19930 [Silvibacterium sp.]